MPDSYYNRCGSCKYLNWKDEYWGKFACMKRKGSYYMCLESATDCKYYEFCGKTDSELEELRLKGLGHRL